MRKLAESERMRDKRGELGAEWEDKSQQPSNLLPPGASGLKPLLRKAEARPSC